MYTYIICDLTFTNMYIYTQAYIQINARACITCEGHKCLEVFNVGLSDLVCVQKR